MDDFKTITEKAAEWGMSSRHIQYLCRKGRINGAVKRAGTWFIPENTPSPAKNTKAHTAGFNFTGTKKRVFDSAIALFLHRGYDNVGLRDIAKNVGIRQSTIYNHFKSKQEILDTIYDYYSHYYIKDRPSMGAMEHKLQNAPLVEIMLAIRHNFADEYLQKMSDITKILLQRTGIDERARVIAKTLIIDEGIRYVEDVFNRLIELGRVTAIDTHRAAVFINGIRMFTLFHWIADPSSGSMARLSEDELALYNSAAVFLEQLKAGETNKQEGGI